MSGKDIAAMRQSARHHAAFLAGHPIPWFSAFLLVPSVAKILDRAARRRKGRG